MAIAAGQVSVGTSATVIYAASGGRANLSVKVPTGGQTVFVGPSGVTTATGMALESGGDVFKINLAGGETLYGVVAATTQTTGYVAQT